MKKVDLTFGIPAYNCEKYVEDLLNEFNKSEDINYEVIIIDDGSTDGTLDKLKQYENDYIKVYTQDNHGVSATRNRIIELASGEWITFVDADDLINFKSYIDVFKKYVNNDNAKYYVNIDKKNLYNKINKICDYNTMLSRLIETEAINGPCSKIYSTKLLRNYNIKFDEQISLGEDLFFNMNYVSKINKIHLFNEKIYTIRFDNLESLSRKYRINKYEELMYVNKECKKKFNDKKIQKSFEYIKIKNCISCLRDCKKFKGKINNEKEILKKTKSTKIIKYPFLNTMWTTFIYYGWIILPKKIFTKI